MCCYRAPSNLKWSEASSETIFGPKQSISEARQQSFTCKNIYAVLHTMVVCQALALFGDAMGEGKSGPVETGLTGLVATACVGALLRKP